MDAFEVFGVAEGVLLMDGLAVALAVEDEVGRVEVLILFDPTPLLL